MEKKMEEEITGKANEGRGERERLKRMKGELRTL